ncbi:MAG: hypothetical protein M1816_000233 [Peltula sp. TS41687]|nr:MAG: hypothetical protein M1816_000233 [Peltula sp. TS41687]
MPTEEEQQQQDLTEMTTPTRLPFKPITSSHISHCSYGYWHGLYRAITPKARIIPLTAAFVEYLREDGIVLPEDDEDPRPSWIDQDSGVYSEERSTVSDNDDDDDDDDEALLDPSEHFRDIHRRIRETIDELGGSVAPKLNWSAPKDATWIAAMNSMQCRRPSDIYLLLKSSDFITHDLEHAFDECDDDDDDNNHNSNDNNFILVLRKWVEMNPSLEFRCFVRARTLLAMCQRDLNHFDFLFPMVEHLRSRIQTFFDTNLKHTFPDEDFVFDVYIPPPHKRVWLIDINPWAPQTDPLIFNWVELLQMDSTSTSATADDYWVVRDEEEEEEKGSSDDDDDDGGDTTATIFVPELRLVKRDDPEAYGFMTPQYSAHKLPKDVVDASRSGPGPLREFADRWKEIQARQQQQEEDAEEEDGVD